MESDEKSLGTYEHDGTVYRGNIEVEPVDQSTYWERVDSMGDGGVGFARTELPSTEHLPDPSGRSERVLKRILIENRDFIEYVRHSMIFDVEHGPADSRSVILHADVPLSGSGKPISGCSIDIEHAYEAIINRFFEEGEILKFYCAVDQALQEVAHMSPSDVGAEFTDPLWTPQAERSDIAPTDSELMEAIKESGVYGSSVKSFDESNYDRESSETNDNSPPD